MDSNQLIRTNDERIDELEQEMLQSFQTIQCQTEDLFSEGLYTRTIYMPKGSFITSLIHKHEHPYIVSQGIASVWIEGKEVILEAPYRGITRAGTRRVLFIHEPTIWTTVHRVPFLTGYENDLSDEEKKEIIDKIYCYIIEEHQNELLGGVVRNNVVTKKIEENQNY